MTVSVAGKDKVLRDAWLVMVNVTGKNKVQGDTWLVTASVAEKDKVLGDTWLVMANVTGKDKVQGDTWLVMANVAREGQSPRGHMACHGQCWPEKKNGNMGGSKQAVRIEIRWNFLTSHKVDDQENSVRAVIKGAHQT